MEFFDITQFVVVAVALQPLGIVEVLFGVIVTGPQPKVEPTVNCDTGGEITQMFLMILSDPQLLLFRIFNLILYVPGVVKLAVSEPLPQVPAIATIGGLLPICPETME